MTRYVWIIPMVLLLCATIWAYGKLMYDKGHSDGWIEGFHLRADTEAKKAIMDCELRHEIREHTEKFDVGCDTCIYQDTDEKKDPCRLCCLSVPASDKKYRSMPLLFERITDEEEEE